MNILELNKKLGAVLEGLENGSIDAKKAQAMVNVSNAMTNNAKLILSAAKLTKSKQMAASLMGANTSELEYNDLYEHKTDFALSQGYKNIVEAIGKMGKGTFEDKFKQWAERHNISL